MAQNVTDTTSPQNASPGVSKPNWLIENIKSLAVPLLIVLAIRSVVIEPFKIPSGWICCQPLSSGITFS